MKIDSKIPILRIFRYEKSKISEKYEWQNQQKKKEKKKSETEKQ